MSDESQTGHDAPRRVWPLVVLVMLGLSAAASYPWVSAIYEHKAYLEEYERCEESVALIRRNRPDDVPEAAWDRAAGSLEVTLGNVCAHPTYMSLEEMRRLAHDLEQRASQPTTSLQTIEWVYQRIAATGPRGESYISRHGPMFRDQVAEIMLGADDSLKTGDAHFARGRYGKAVAAYDKVIERFPERWEGHRRRALTLGIQGKRDPAKADLLAWARRRPETPYPAVWLAAIAGDASRLATVRTQEGWPAALARFHLDEMQPEELLAVAAKAERAYERKGRLCDAHCFIGIRREGKKDVSGARQSYAAAIDAGKKSFGTYGWAYRRLRDLRR